MSAVRSRRFPPKTNADYDLGRQTSDESKDRRQSFGSSCPARLLFVVSLLSLTFCIGTIMHSPQFVSQEEDVNHHDSNHPRLVLLSNDRNVTRLSISIDKRKGRKRDRVVAPKSRAVAQMSSARAQAEIADSRRYVDLDDTELEDKDDCQLEYEWQQTSRPNCNSIHEFDMTTISLDNGDAKYKYLTHGFYRDVISAHDDAGRPFVFKPMRLRHRFSFRNFDRMRRDGVIMERLTAHKYILNIYGFCGTSATFEFADGGDIDSALWPNGNTRTNLTQLEKLHIGTYSKNAALSLLTS